MSRRRTRRILCSLVVLLACGAVVARVPSHPAGSRDAALAAAPGLEAQEKAEPNVRVKTPPRRVYRQSAFLTAPAEPSPSSSASFLGQADIPQIGMTKTESPPDTSGAVGRDRLMVTLNNNYVIQRKSDGAVLSTQSISSFWAAAGAP